MIRIVAGRMQATATNDNTSAVRSRRIGNPSGVTCRLASAAGIIAIWAPISTPTSLSSVRHQGSRAVRRW